MPKKSKSAPPTAPLQPSMNYPWYDDEGRLDAMIEALRQLPKPPRMTPTASPVKETGKARARNTLVGGVKQAKDAWVKWLQGYGADKFYDAFLDRAQEARSECVCCHQQIYLDIVGAGGGPDWGRAIPGTAGLDYSCGESPVSGKDGMGRHVPVGRLKLRY